MDYRKSFSDETLFKLKEMLGTPLYIYDELMLKQRMQDYYESFVSNMFETNVVYASKAFLCSELIGIVMEQGLYMDAVSQGELYAQSRAGFDMQRVYFHGNNKSCAELKQALELNVGRIVIDNPCELDDLIDIARGAGKGIKALIRLNPSLTAHTHEYDVTASPQSKFGIDINDEQTLVSMIEKMNDSEYVSFDGFHAHIGSQIFELEIYDRLIELMFGFCKMMNEKYAVSANTLNIGGGFAAKYTDEDKPISTRELCSHLIEKAQSCYRHSYPHLKTLAIEPGRSIVAEAGYTLYTSGYLKQTPGKLYAFIDGGMPDNIRPALYGAEYECDIVGRDDKEAKAEVSISGKCCESGDIIIKKASISVPKPGELIIVYSTGAYGYTMSSNYNRLCRPAVVFVCKDLARLAVKGESFEDMCRLDRNELLF